ncbi:MAG: hypothetical protein K0S35_2047 [Geminicoccaceae bacterium]|nr:hypothetical protein [Geminicoccaceae bacterium]
MLLEDHRLDIRLLDHRVDDHELGVGEFLGDLLERGGEGEADRDHHVGAAARHPAERLVALRLVGDLEFEILDPGLLLEALGAVVGGFVEGLVELAAHVEDDRRRELGGHRGAGGEQARRERRKKASCHPSPSADPRLASG